MENDLIPDILIVPNSVCSLQFAAYDSSLKRMHLFDKTRKNKKEKTTDKQTTATTATSTTNPRTPASKRRQRQPHHSDGDVKPPAVCSTSRSAGASRRQATARFQSVSPSAPLQPPPPPPPPSPPRYLWQGIPLIALSVMKLCSCVHARASISECERASERGFLSLCVRALFCECW